MKRVPKPWRSGVFTGGPPRGGAPPPGPPPPPPPLDPQQGRLRRSPLDPPAHIDAAARSRQRAILRGVGGQLVQSQRQGQRDARRHREWLALDRDPVLRFLRVAEMRRGGALDDVAQV